MVTMKQIDEAREVSNRMLEVYRASRDKSFAEQYIAIADLNAARDAVERLLREWWAQGCVEVLRISQAHRPEDNRYLTIEEIRKAWKVPDVVGIINDSYPGYKQVLDSLCYCKGVQFPHRRDSGIHVDRGIQYNDCKGEDTR